MTFGLFTAIFGTGILVAVNLGVDLTAGMGVDLWVVTAGTGLTTGETSLLEIRGEGGAVNCRTAGLEESFGVGDGTRRLDVVGRTTRNCGF